MSRPTFLLTKGQRNQAYDDFDMLPRYVDAFRSRFVWDGLPEGCPEDYIEECLFFASGVGIKKLRGYGPAVFAAAPSSVLDIYGHPIEWMPLNILGGTSMDPEVYRPSKEPVLWIPPSMIEKITPYLTIMKRAVNALNQNMVGMSQPVVIEADIGAELNTSMMKSKFSDGELFLPILGRKTVPAQVLDLNVNDYTHSLLGVIHDMDSQILSIMGYRTANEKASGVSDLEAGVAESLIRSKIDNDLRLREAWRDEVNDRFGMDLSVRIAGPMFITDNTPNDDIISEGENDVS